MPSLVYAALKTIIYMATAGFRNAENIKQQASEVHARLKKFNDDFFSKIGTDLGRAIKSYNNGEVMGQSLNAIRQEN